MYNPRTYVRFTGREMKYSGILRSKYQKQCESWSLPIASLSRLQGYVVHVCTLFSFLFFSFLFVQVWTWQENIEEEEEVKKIASVHRYMYHLRAHL